MRFDVFFIVRTIPFILLFIFSNFLDIDLVFFILGEEIACLVFSISFFVKVFIRTLIFLFLGDCADGLVKTLFTKTRVNIHTSVDAVVDEVREKLVLNMNRVFAKETAVKLFVLFCLALYFESFQRKFFAYVGHINDRVFVVQEKCRNGVKETLPHVLNDRHEVLSILFHIIKLLSA